MLELGVVWYVNMHVFVEPDLPLGGLGQQCSCNVYQCMCLGTCSTTFLCLGSLVCAFSLSASICRCCSSASIMVEGATLTSYRF